METSIVIAELIQFSGAIYFQIFIFRKDAGHLAIPTFNFGIF